MHIAIATTEMRTTPPEAPETMAITLTDDFGEVFAGGVVGSVVMGTILACGVAPASQFR
jgi:hypothetical protein